MKTKPNQELEDLKVGDKVKVVGGNNEIGQPTMMGKVGVISSFGTKYTVKGLPTIEVFVEFEHFGLHVFNDYHLMTEKQL